MQNFRIVFPKILIWFNICIFGLSLCSTLLWQAPLLYRSSVMSLICLVGIFHYLDFNKIYRRYPYKLNYRNESWYLDNKPVQILASSHLGAHWAVIHVRDIEGKKMRLVVTRKSLQDQEEYFTLIRFLKIHRVSA